MTIDKCYAKINVLLKITGKSNDYHEILSRFVKIDNLYDDFIIIEKKQAKFLEYKSCKNLDISQLFSLKTAENTIFKEDCILDYFIKIDDNIISNFYSNNHIFYKVFNNFNPKFIKEFLDKYAIVLYKRIPTFAGLASASSNAATLIKHLCLLSNEDKDKIAAKSGADVSFFINEFASANVYGYGQIIKEFKEEKLDVNLHFSTPCSTKEVFNHFAKNPIYYKNTDDLDLKTSKELLLNDNYFLNDLLFSCTQLYPKAKEFAEKKYFLSGSGGMFFSIK